jgi:DNA/RNA-binding domain of Phe-tRNA-synthetase-like protein
MLTEKTRNAILVIESVDPARDEDLERALKTLAGYVESYLGGKTNTRLLTKPA